MRMRVAARVKENNLSANEQTALPKTILRAVAVIAEVSMKFAQHLMNTHEVDRRHAVRTHDALLCELFPFSCTFIQSISATRVALVPSACSMHKEGIGWLKC